MWGITSRKRTQEELYRQSKEERWKCRLLPPNSTFLSPPFMIMWRGIKIGARTPTILSYTDEKKICNPQTLAKDLAWLPYRHNLFKDGVPGKDWWQLFFKCWKKEVSAHSCQPIEQLVQPKKSLMNGLGRLINYLMILALRISTNDLTYTIFPLPTQKCSECSGRGSEHQYRYGCCRRNSSFSWLKLIDTIWWTRSNHKNMS